MNTPNTPFPTNVSMANGESTFDVRFRKQVEHCKEEREYVSNEWEEKSWKGQLADFVLQQGFNQTQQIPSSIISFRTLNKALKRERAQEVTMLLRNNLL